jgi:hypothetical protein
MFPYNQLRVLLLGIYWDSEIAGLYPRTMYGLLMLPHEGPWARVGICQWSCQYDYTSSHISLGEKEKGFLQGYDELWVEQNGIFGYAD